MYNYIATAEKIEVKNYPYGYSLKTTLFNYIEFDVKKGYRQVTQTVNPKTGRLNAPKKSTYSPLILRYYDGAGHIRSFHFDFNGSEAINHGSKFVFEAFQYFEEKEISYIMVHILFMIKITLKASIMYSGCKFEDLKPIFEPVINTLTTGLKDPKTNIFDQIILDLEKVKAVTPADFNPFKTISFGIIK